MRSGSVRSTTSTRSPPSTQASAQSVLTKLAMWPEPRAAAGQAERQDRADVGDVGFAMLTTYMSEPRSCSARSLTTSSLLPHRSTSSFSKCGSGSAPTACGDAGLRDVEHGQAAPAADERVVVLEGHAGGGAGDVVEHVDVPRGGERRLTRPQRRRRPPHREARVQPVVRAGKLPARGPTVAGLRPAAPSASRARPSSRAARGSLLARMPGPFSSTCGVGSFVLSGSDTSSG